MEGRGHHHQTGRGSAHPPGKTTLQAGSSITLTPETIDKFVSNYNDREFPWVGELSLVKVSQSSSEDTRDVVIVSGKMANVIEESKGVMPVSCHVDNSSSVPGEDDNNDGN